MRRIDQMLKQWLPVNTLVREQFRNIIVLYVQRKMDEAFLAGRELEKGVCKGGQTNQRVIEELKKIKGLGITYTDDIIDNRIKELKQQ
tara:strand:- start:332 stop:595 length:264 start_codon:yes stop_codon:yes gene_type:complete